MSEALPHHGARGLARRLRWRRSLHVLSLEALWSHRGGAVARDLGRFWERPQFLLGMDCYERGLRRAQAVQQRQEGSESHPARPSRVSRGVHSSWLTGPGSLDGQDVHLECSTRGREAQRQSLSRSTPLPNVPVWLLRCSQSCERRGPSFASLLLGSRVTNLKDKIHGQ